MGTNLNPLFWGLKLPFTQAEGQPEAAKDSFAMIHSPNKNFAFDAIFARPMLAFLAGITGS